MEASISKSEAKALCSKCPKYGQTARDGCYYGDIEGYRGEDVPLNTCRYLSELITKNQRPPEGQHPDKPPALVNHTPNTDFRDVNHIADNESKAQKNTSTPCQPKRQPSGCFQGVKINPPKPELTPAQKKLTPFLIAGKTQNQIADALGISRQAVNKHIKRMREKGYLSFDNKLVIDSEPTMSTPRVNLPASNYDDGTHQIRNHDHHWVVDIPKILNWQNMTKYNRKIGRYVQDDPRLENNTIYYGKESIEIQGKNKSFIGKDSPSAFRKSLEYWGRFFRILEAETHLELVRPGYQNIRLAYQHFSEVGNELAIECEMTGKKLKVYATDDGKLCYEIDDSLKLKEFESKHPQTAEGDMEKVSKVFKDIRENDLFLPSEQQKILNEHTEAIIYLQEVQLANQAPKEIWHREGTKRRDPAYG